MDVVDSLHANCPSGRLLGGVPELGDGKGRCLLGGRKAGDGSCLELQLVDGQ